MKLVKFELKLFWYNLKEKIYWWLAWRLPSKLVYFATIRLATWASQSKEYENTEVPSIRIMDALSVWEKEL